MFPSDVIFTRLITGARRYEARCLTINNNLSKQQPHVNTPDDGMRYCYLYKHPVTTVNAGSLACHNTQTALPRPCASRYEDIIISIYIVMCELCWNILCKWTSDENLSRKCYTFYTFFTQEWIGYQIYFMFPHKMEILLSTEYVYKDTSRCMQYGIVWVELWTCTWKYIM